LVKIIVSGFGGQGILFLGKIIIKCGISQKMRGTFLPSYGPEMRGGTANCHVTLYKSKNAVYSPIITNPDILISMNNQSFEEFKDTVKPGGTIFANDFHVKNNKSVTDVNLHCFPLKKIAEEIKCNGKENMVILGAFIKLTEIFKFEEIVETMKNSISKSTENLKIKNELIENNKRAINAGFEFAKVNYPTS
jgi:Pyruvate/2-oxoacid:ferredoxin oxidoreductase gamma subunit